MPRGNTIRIPDGCYTNTTLAKAVGVSKDTVVRWRTLGFLPFTTQQAGALDVYIYGPEALAIAKSLATGKEQTLNERAKPAA